VAKEPADMPEHPNNMTVHFRSDGLALSPADYSRLLVRLAEERGIAADEFSSGGVVGELEERMAALLGKEMAVFLPSGTLANHLALRLLATRGHRVLVQRESHIYNDTGDCVEQLGGLKLIPLAPGKATFSLAEVETEVAAAQEGRVATSVGVISIECPVRRVRGEVFDFTEMQRITDIARERRIGLHLDGARVFLASAYTEITPRSYAALFDTVMFHCTNTSMPPVRPCSPGPSISSTTSTISGACSAAACGKPGRAQQSRSIISMGSASDFTAPRQRPKPCSRAEQPSRLRNSALRGFDQCSISARFDRARRYAARAVADARDRNPAGVASVE
jgi:hypothetical protein